MIIAVTEKGRRAMNDMRERLIELIQQIDEQCHKTIQCNDCPGYGYGMVCKSHLIAEYLIANCVIVPLCKVEDNVYTNVPGTTLQNEFVVQGISLLGFTNGIYSWTWHQLGKSVFLTKEEAERALKEREQNGC